MKMPFFKPNKYNVPQVAPVPADNEAVANGVYINEARRCFRIDIFDKGTPGTLESALGTLEIAKDILKHQIPAWHAKQQAQRGILVPKGNGHA